MSVENILTGIRNTLQQIVPDIFPAVRLDEAPGTGTLDTSLVQGAQAVRQWRIYPRVDVQADWFNGSLCEVRQTFVIEIRYHLTEPDGGETQARILAGSDAARLVQQLSQNFCWTSAPELTQFLPLRSRNLQRLDNDTYLVELEYTATYFLGGTVPPEISP